MQGNFLYHGSKAAAAAGSACAHNGVNYGLLNSEEIRRRGLPAVIPAAAGLPRTASSINDILCVI